MIKAIWCFVYYELLQARNTDFLTNFICNNNLYSWCNETTFILNGSMSDLCYLYYRYDGQCSINNGATALNQVSIIREKSPLKTPLLMPIPIRITILRDFLIPGSVILRLLKGKITNLSVKYSTKYSIKIEK